MPIKEVDIDAIYSGQCDKTLTISGILTHIKATLDADLQYPIILDEEGFIMNGRHRLMKAIINNIQTIKIVRFYPTPEPCFIEKD